MKPLTEVVDRCLSMMKPHKLFDWAEWWTNVVEEGETPRNKSYEYYKFIMKRNRLKKSVNKELEARRLPERLICVGNGKGVYLVNETGEHNVADTTIHKRVCKIVRAFEISHKEMTKLAHCQRLLPEDQKALLRTSDLMELHGNTIIGTIAKIKALPPATKTRLLKSLGIDTKSKKKDEQVEDSFYE